MLCLFWVFESLIGHNTSKIFCHTKYLLNMTEIVGKHMENSLLNKGDNTNISAVYKPFFQTPLPVWRKVDIKK